jgi:hypothetical protein
METTQQKSDRVTPLYQIDWGKFLSLRILLQNVGFLFFVSILVVVYISIVHKHDKLLKEIGATEKSIKNLEYDLKAKKSDLIYRSKASELVKAVAPLGLNQLKDAPVVLIDSSGTSIK